MSGSWYFCLGLGTGFLLTCFAVAVGVVYQAVTKAVAIAPSAESRKEPT